VTEPAEPEVPERATRRTYIALYKLRIPAEYEPRYRDGKGALLRREGLYTSLISEWLHLGSKDQAASVDEDVAFATIDDVWRHRSRGHRRHQ